MRDVHEHRDVLEQKSEHSQGFTTDDHITTFRVRLISRCAGPLTLVGRLLHARERRGIRDVYIDDDDLN
jgi:hypothetical protein